MNIASDIIYLEVSINQEDEGLYLLQPFVVPPDVERLELHYDYGRFDKDWLQIGKAEFTARPEINIIDLGLIGPDGRQVGASGSDKQKIFVSEAESTPGYRRTTITPGEWQILVGAYKVAPEGVKVYYQIELKHKSPRWLKGDLHTHTLASDGVLNAKELGKRAVRHGLDFLAITDHNQMVTLDALPPVPGLTWIQGVEWTHYLGHANFLGVDEPYAEPFFANEPEEIERRFINARERGAFISLNHPFEVGCELKLDWQRLSFDCLEVWNGPMRESNLRALGLWQELLKAGRKIPICGGSDYHRDTPFIFPGGPTTHVYSDSNGVSDILAALRGGRAYLTFAPNGPWLEMSSGEEVGMGDSVSWTPGCGVILKAGGLLKGDAVRVVAAAGAETIVEAPESGEVEAGYEMLAPGFARVEIWRSFLPGVPMLPALISNPIYFNASG